MLKKVKIEQLEEKFKLISHPFPQISGEMLVIRPRKIRSSTEITLSEKDCPLPRRPRRVSSSS